MIITRTPLRVSFAGGGSDLKVYYEKYGGAVLSVAINKYIYLSAHPYFHCKKILLKYSKNELVDSVDQIDHKIIKQLLSDYNISGIDLNSTADVPAGTGLGSSSTFTVGLINLCNVFTQKYMNKEKIAEYACKVEIEKLKEPIGKQDQYAAAVGGLNYISFNQDNTVNIEKIIMNKEKYTQLQNNMIMLYLGDTRSASNILYEQKKNMKENDIKVKNMHKMVNLAKVLKEELLKNNIDSMGECLYEGWMLKKELAGSITNEKIDHYYTLAVKNGALGGKLLGAGGGGFLLFYVKEEKREGLKIALKDLDEFKFEFDNEGTTVIYYCDNL